LICGRGLIEGQEDVEAQIEVRFRGGIEEGAGELEAGWVYEEIGRQRQRSTTSKVACIFYEKHTSRYQAPGKESRCPKLIVEAGDVAADHPCQLLSGVSALSPPKGNKALPFNI
jgi:hypothetical protein